jgi:hypothetical protein
VTDDRQPAARRLAHQIVHVGQVVGEVVVAAGADAIRIAMAAQVGRHDVVRPGQPGLDHAREGPGEVEVAVQQQDRVVALGRPTRAGAYARPVLSGMRRELSVAMGSDPCRHGEAELAAGASARGASPTCAVWMAAAMSAVSTSASVGS